MNNLILYAIIIVIIYYLCFNLGNKKEGYSIEETKAIDECVKAYKEYNDEKDPIMKPKKEAILKDKYEAILKINPDFFKNGIPEDIMRMI
jgi:hypothetical protein